MESGYPSWTLSGRERSAKGLLFGMAGLNRDSYIETARKGSLMTETL